MKAIHDDMLAPLRDASRGCHVVLFMVHSVLHQWAEDGLSRPFSSPRFFDTPIEELWLLHEETALVVAIQDELSRDHFIQLEPMAKVEWCEGLFATDSVWSEAYPNAVQAMAAWKSYRKNKTGSYSFADVMKIYRSKISSDCSAVVRPVEAYGVYDDSKTPWPIYEARHDIEYAYCKRTWWNTVADKTILLTTESLVTEMFKAATSGMAEAGVCDCMDLTVQAGQVEVHIQPSLKSADNQKTATAFRDLHKTPDMHVICNSAPDLLNSTTIPSAKGSNDLTDTDILQIVNFVSPSGENGTSEYDALQIINHVYGFTTAIRMQHVDTINQIAGRNLGFRYVGRRHCMLISRRLWELLEKEIEHEMRYSVTTIMDAATRRDRHNGQERTLINRLAKEQEDEDAFASYWDCERSQRIQILQAEESARDHASQEYQLMFEEYEAA